MADSFNKNPPQYYSPPGYQQPFPDYYSYYCNYPQDRYQPKNNESSIDFPHEEDIDPNNEEINTYRIPILETFPWQESVISKELTYPPDDVTKGDRYLILNEPVGFWSGHLNDIAWYDGNEWKFDSPLPGWVVFIEDEDIYYHFNNNQWIYGITASGNEMYFDSTFKTLIITPSLVKP